MSDDIFVAKGGAVVIIGDRRIVLHEGQTVRAGHPLMQGREHLFVPFTVDFELDDSGQADAPSQPQPAAKDVRAWAAEQGIDVPARGQLPADLVARYLAAQQGA